MARSANTDPLLSHNFALLEIPVAGLLPIAFPIKTVQDELSSGRFVGFRSISFPEVSIEHRDIKEGNWPYLHKVPTGHVDSGQITLEFAVFPWNMDMWVYFSQAIWGRVAPRRSFLIVQMRNQKASIKRVYWLEDCVPVSWKPTSDMDAMSSEVLVETLTMNVHRIRIVPTPTSISSVPLPNISSPF